MVYRRRTPTKSQLTVLNAIGRKQAKLDRRKDAVEEARAELAECFIKGAALGLSQQRMAEEAGISQSWVKLLLRGAG